MLTLYRKIIIRNGSKRECDPGRMKKEFWAGKISRWPLTAQPPSFKIRAHSIGDYCKGEKSALQTRRDRAAVAGGIRYCSGDTSLLLQYLVKLSSSLDCKFLLNSEYPYYSGY